MSDQQKEITPSFGVNSQIANENIYERDHRLSKESVGILLILVFSGINWAAKHPDQILYYFNLLKQGP